MTAVMTEGGPAIESTWRRWCIAIGVLALVVIGVKAALPTPNPIPGYEQQLRAGYINPLADSGATVEIIDACHYRRDVPGEPWHLSLQIVVHAPVDEVIDTLQPHIGVIRTDHDPVITQQYRGEPGRGWNGSIERSGTGTVVGLVKNNVDVKDSTVGVGWMQVCAEP